MRKAKGFTLSEVLVIAVILGTVATLGCLGPLSRARESARRAACLSNLKQIMFGIKTYTPDYNESYPTDAAPGDSISIGTHYKALGILYPNYVSSLDVFTCPSSGDKMPQRTDARYDAKPFRANEAKSVSYAYGYNGESATNKAWTEAAPSQPNSPCSIMSTVLKNV